MTSPVDSTARETEGEGGKTKGLINAIKLPLVSVIPRKLRSTKVWKKISCKIIILKHPFNAYLICLCL